MMLSTTAGQVIMLVLMSMSYFLGYLVRDLFEAGKSFEFPETDRPKASSARDIMGNKDIGDA